MAATERQRKTTYILGAGFSKAIAPSMPDTDALGDLIIGSLSAQERKVLNPPDFSKSKMSFEHWLSWLAEKQPYESEREYYSHLANFSRIQSLIGDLLRQRQGKVLERPIPEWLSMFAQLLHESEATVITLNYDSLLEKAFEKLRMPNEFGGAATRLDLTKIFPQQWGRMYTDSIKQYSSTKTFDLYKLHGSFDWFWVPGDITGSSLEIVEIATSEIDQERKANRAARGGKQEFIVPPTHAKSQFLTNAKMRYQWEESYRALSESSRVVIAGYSLPDNDSAMASMLSRAVSGTDAEILILNPKPEGVITRIESLGIDYSRISFLKGKRSIQNFVESELDLLSHEFTNQLARLWKSNRYSPLAVGWNELCLGGVRGASVNPKNGQLTLLTHEFGPLQNLKIPGDRQSMDISSKPSITYSDLLKITNKFDGIMNTRVKIRDFEYRPVIDFLPTLPGLSEDPHHPEKHWLAFRTIGTKPY